MYVTVAMSANASRTTPAATPQPPFVSAGMYRSTGSALAENIARTGDSRKTAARRALPGTETSEFGKKSEDPTTFRPSYLSHVVSGPYLAAPVARRTVM